MIVAVGWLLRRLQQCADTGPTGLDRRRSQVITVAAQQMLDTHEKIVVADVEDTWLVLGVARQHVQTLCTLPRPVEAVSTPNDPSSDDTSGSDEPPHFTDALSIQLKRHLTGRSE